jgi:uncharacterized membrane protein YbaN (DUF454 family)
MGKFDLVGFISAFIAQVEQFPWLAQKLIGGIMILVGILGLILPILPGWLLILPGLSILHPPFRTSLVNFEREKKVLKRFKVGLKAIQTMKLNRLCAVFVF